MKKIHHKNIAPICDTEYSEVLRKIAVTSGLQLPETSDEVELFEIHFAEEISAADLDRPSLESILALSKKCKNSNATVFNPSEEVPVDHGFSMAARNGQDITDETLSLMDKALQQAREKKKSGT